MHDLVFLKLGGSVLTDKTRPEALNHATLQQVATAIAAGLVQPDAPRLLLGHGAGSFGHHWAREYQTHLGVSDDRGWEGVTRVSDAMGRLNRDVVAHLLTAGVRAISAPPSASAISEAGTLVSMASEPLAMMLAAGLVPVVHGDVIVDRHQGAAIASTEMVFAFLARSLRPRRIVLVGEIGVFTADPHRDSTAERIPLIDDSNIVQVLGQATGSHGIDVTGGMASKVRTMWDLVCALQDLEVLLVGPDPVAVASALQGDAATGTMIRRSGLPQSLA